MILLPTIVITNGKKSSNDGNTFIEQELNLSSQLPRNDTVTNDATTYMVAS